MVSVKDGLTAATRYKPLGAVAVLGPFNLPDDAAAAELSLPH